MLNLSHYTMVRPSPKIFFAIKIKDLKGVEYQVRVMLIDSNMHSSEAAEAILHPSTQNFLPPSLAL
jgi:hypothetical protein